MKGYARVVVHPHDVLTAEAHAALGHEAARGRGAFLGTYLGKFPVADAGHGIIAAREPERDQMGRRQFALLGGGVGRHERLDLPPRALRRWTRS